VSSPRHPDHPALDENTAGQELAAILFWSVACLASKLAAGHVNSQVVQGAHSGNGDAPDFGIILIVSSWPPHALFKSLISRGFAKIHDPKFRNANHETHERARKELAPPLDGQQRDQLERGAV